MIYKIITGGACNFIKKETLAQLFSCDFCEISKNTFPYRTPLVTASEKYNLPCQALLIILSVNSAGLFTVH